MLRSKISKATIASVIAILYGVVIFTYSTSRADDNDIDVFDVLDDIVITNPDAIAVDIPSDNNPPVVIEEATITKNQRYFEQLVSPDSTSILIMAKEPTLFNFDTIIILNLDKTEKKVKLINLPRDIYIDYSDEIVEAVRKVKSYYPDDPGFYKINAVPSVGQYINYKNDAGRFKKDYRDFLADVIEEVFSIHADDYIYVQVKGFRNIVDYFGGVYIDVPVRMYYEDPYQDFRVDLQKGYQRLNGEQAEGFVRFRQGYDENGHFINHGDLFRKNNQNKFIKAFIDQHVTLKNLGKLPGVAEIVKSNLRTSVDTWDKIVNYAALAEEAVINGYTIENVNLEFSDTQKYIKGSSYIVIKEADQNAGGDM